MSPIPRKCTDCGKWFPANFDWQFTCSECSNDLERKWLPPEKITETVHIAGQYPKRIYISTSRGCGKSELMRQMFEERLKKGDTVFVPWSFKLPEETSKEKIDMDNMDALCYSLKDIEIVKEAYNTMNKNEPRLRIKKLIFDYPATIVYWYDDTKTVVKCREGETFDLETGLAMAICKKQMGDTYKSQFRKWIKNAVIKNKAPEISNTDKLNKALNDVLDDIDGMSPLQDVMDQMGSGAVPSQLT